jgi:DNA-binding response OmpR family regulator
MPRISVLVVDDDEDHRDLLTLILETECYAVLQASRGGDALQRVNNQRVNLVILDLVLPDVEGEVIARMIKKQKPALRIVAMSASPERQTEAWASRVDAFLAKPFDLDEFLDVVRRLALPDGSPASRKLSVYEAFAHSSIDGTCSARST